MPFVFLLNFSHTCGSHRTAEHDEVLQPCYFRPGPGHPVDMKSKNAELDRLYSAAYEELRRLAHAVRRDDPNASLNPTALVNEAYLKLAASLQIPLASRQHFKRIAARAMRQVLVEAARRRKARKRGADYVFVTFNEEIDGPVRQSDQVLALDTALERLARMEPRQAQMVECRFFGGYGVKETAELLDVSEATIARDWRAAKAWLALELLRPG